MGQVSGSLFEATLPAGFHYRDTFIDTDEETQLASEIAHVRFSVFEMRGVVARRRVAFFGRSYESGAVPSPAIPPFLFSLRDKLAAWAELDPERFAMALINEYQPGAPIGWHRDAPQYDIVAGISLLSPCVMRFRPYLSRRSAAGAKADVSPREQRASATRRSATHEIILERRSAYVMTAEARNGYEHHVPEVKALRYSVTFRTLRA